MDINESEGLFADQLSKLHDIGFTDLKANITALVEAKGNLDATIDILIEESRKPVAFSIPREVT